MDCVISLKTPGGTQAPSGEARMRLHTQRTPPEALRPIWQQRPQALPLHCPATGMQTGLVCFSARLVHLLPSRRKAELSQTTCPSSPRNCSQVYIPTRPVARWQVPCKAQSTLQRLEAKDV